MIRKNSCPLPRQRGAALFVSLILLLVLTLIGVTAAQMQTAEERMAFNDNNHQLALQNGEAALLDSDTQFLDSDYTFDSTNGQWPLTSEPNSGGLADQWGSFATNAATYTGPALSGVSVPNPYVLVEQFAPISTASLSGQGYQSQEMGPVARSTTLASGADSTSQIVVQSIAYNPP